AEQDFAEVFAKLHVTPQRISLPTYPFARERYWISENSTFSLSRQQSQAATLHPFLHRNISVINQIRFATMLTGSEKVLQREEEQGNAIFPDLALLEIALAAAVESSPAQTLAVDLKLGGCRWHNTVRVAGPSSLYTFVEARSVR